MAWDPSIYLKYQGERTRPAADLLAHISNEAPRSVIDLGCGPGNSTALLAARWPTAVLTGVDSDSAMLERASASGLKATWEEADITTWQPSSPPDVIFSNAALHWLDRHEILLPRLAGFLIPGGTLAVQMPRNHAAPSHALLRDVAHTGPWAKVLAPLLKEAPVADPEVYFRWLAPHTSSIEIWETTYLMRLSGADPVLSWVRGTVLRPILEALSERHEAAFEAAYAERLRAAYPREADGSTLFPFRRLFIVAQR